MPERLLWGARTSNWAPGSSTDFTLEARLIKVTPPPGTMPSARGSFNGGHGVIHAEFLLFYLCFCGTANLNNGYAAVWGGAALVVLCAVIGAGCGCGLLRDFLMRAATACGRPPPSIIVVASLVTNTLRAVPTTSGPRFQRSCQGLQKLPAHRLGWRYLLTPLCGGHQS